MEEKQPLRILKIPHALFLIISKKAWLKDIARLRQTCRAMNNFFSEHHLQLSAACPQKLEIYPRLLDQGKMDTVSFRSTSYINEDRSTLLTDPKRQVEAAKFHVIEIAVNKLCYNLDTKCDGKCQKGCLKSLLHDIRLSCHKLILTGVEQPRVWEAVHFLAFKELQVRAATVENLASLPEYCINVDARILNKFPTDEVLFRFEDVKIGCFSEEDKEEDYDSTGEPAFDINFDQFLLTLRRTRVCGQLRFLQIPCLYENDTGGIRQLDEQQFGVTRIYDGYRYQITKKGRCNLYLMEFTQELVPLIVIKETPVHGEFEEVYELMILNNNEQDLSRAISEILFRYFPVDSSKFYEEIKEKEWTEFPQLIERFYEFYGGPGEGYRSDD